MAEMANPEQQGLKLILGHLPLLVPHQAEMANPEQQGLKPNPCSITNKHPCRNG